MRRRTKQQAARFSEGKDGYDTYLTARELAARLNKNESTVKRWARAGTIPQADIVSSAGWMLWSPDTVQRIIRITTNRGTSG